MRLESSLGLVEQTGAMKFCKNARSLRLRNTAKHERRHGKRRQLAVMLRSDAQHVHPMLKKLRCEHLRLWVADNAAIKPKPSAHQTIPSACM